MKPPKFHVGQAVVCVIGPPPGWKPPYGEVVPEKGKIYRVREVAAGSPNEWGVLLEEIVNKPNAYSQGWHECGFPERYFAPVEYASDEALAQLLEETLEPVTA